jgi:hypothetical protein
MKRILLLVIMITIAGCQYIPSKWDSNEARSIIDIEMSAKHFDCSNIPSQINDLTRQVEWFNTYSESRGSNDIVALFAELDKTVKEFKDRSDKGSVSGMYCEIKKKILIQQTEIVARAVQLRF